VRSDLSPWNVAGTARGGGEWVVSGDSLAAGGAKSINMAARRQVAPGTALGYRFVFR